MLDTVLNIGCAFDWMTPTLAFVQDVLYGPASHFGIPANTGWGRGDIKRLLSHYGVKAWGLMYNLNGDMLMFAVPKSKTRWVYFLLQREGVPILFAPPEASDISKGTSFFDQLERIYSGKQFAPANEKHTDGLQQKIEPPNQQGILFPSDFFGRLF